MNAEYLLIFAVFNTKSHDLIERENLKYINNELYQNLYMVSCFLKENGMNINLENSIKVIYKAIPYEQQQKDAISELKAICARTDIMAHPNPVYALRKQFYQNMKESALKRLQACDTPDEQEKIYEEFLNECTRRRKNNIREIRTIFDDYLNAEVETTRKFILRDPNLKLIFGSYIYSQLYSITGIPGWYKTTFLYCIINDLVFSGKNVLHIGMEDTTETSACKLLAGSLREKKFNLIEKSTSREMIEKGLSKYKGNLYIDDESRTASEIMHDIENAIIDFNLDCVTLDFYQMVKPARNQNKYDAICEMAHNLATLYKKYKIPIIGLSQTTSANVREVEQGKKELSGGDERGGAEIYDLTRWAFYINPIMKNQDGTGVVSVKCAKGENGIGGKRFEVTFEGASGYLLETIEVSNA